MDPITLDSQMLIDLYGGSYDDARFILNDYLDKHNGIINSFNDAFKAGIKSLTKCSHRHASSFTYIGIPQLTASCRDFELHCKNAADTTEVKAEFERLLSMIDQGALLVKQELARLKRV